MVFLRIGQNILLHLGQRALRDIHHAPGKRGSMVNEISKEPPCRFKAFRNHLVEQFIIRWWLCGNIEEVVGRGWLRICFFPVPWVDMVPRNTSAGIKESFEHSMPGSKAPRSVAKRI